jgi:thiamine biosynthesis lipoprotein ApbE
MRVAVVFLVGGILARAVVEPALAQEGGESKAYRYIMGTSIEVQAFGGTAETRAGALEEAFGAFAEVDRLMSNYRDDSELTRINRDAAARPVRISDPMMSVLQAAQKVSAQSSGGFDATVGPLVRLWGFHDKKPHQPSAEEFTAVRPLVDYRNVVLNATQHTVSFSRPGVEIDLGGIAKGFAVEVAANVLRQHGLSGFIDAGGNQYLLGTPPGKRAWSVGVKNPDKPDRLLGTIETAETSVSTSADYATFVEINGRRYGHILDPHTLQPSSAALSVTVLSRDGTMADALSKAAFILGPTAGLALIESMPGMSGLIAYHKPDGSMGIAKSRGLGGAFHLAE